MAISFHPEASEMKKILDKHGVQKLYHFTSIDNLSVIAECGGLLSKQRLEQAGLLNKIKTGGNELSLDLDRELGNWDKVHLYFCPKTPMAYRIQQNPEGRNPQSAHICYLIVDPIVAMWDGVFFTDTNATQKIDGHQRKQGLEGLKLIDFDIIKAHLKNKWVEPKQRWHRNVQAECLVPDEIPLTYVKAISFISDASLKEGERVWESVEHPPFNVDKNLFHRGFPVVEKYLLTSQEVNKDNVNSTQFPDKRVFSTPSVSSITLLVNLFANAGTQVKVIWLDNSGKIISKDEIEFERESGYGHWPSLEIADLEDGNYSVEYYLKEIRWFKAHFKIGG